MTSATEFGSRFESSSKSGSLKTDTLQRFVLRRLINFFKWIFSTSPLSMASSSFWVVIVRYCVGCLGKICSLGLENWIRGIEDIYVNPLFTTEDGNQLGVRLQCLKVVLVVNLGAVRVQVDPWHTRLSELLHRLFLKLSKVPGHNRLLDLPGYVFDLD